MNFICLLRYVISYINSTLNQICSIVGACGYTRGGRTEKQMALKVLLELMAELKSLNHIQTNPVTYKVLLKATKALLPDDSKRRPLSATIFEACCKQGQLDETVLEALQNAQPELYAKLPGTLPPKWKSNVMRNRY